MNPQNLVCSNCAAIDSGELKKPFWGRRYFTCGQCGDKTKLPLKNSTVWILWFLFVLFSFMYLYDMFENKRIWVLNKLFINMFTSTFYSTLLVGLPLYFHYRRMKQKAVSTAILISIISMGVIPPSLFLIKNNEGNSSAVSLAKSANAIISKEQMVIESFLDKRISMADYIKMAEGSESLVQKAISNYDQAYNDLYLTTINTDVTSGKYLQIKKKSAKAILECISAIRGNDVGLAKKQFGLSTEYFEEAERIINEKQPEQSVAQAILPRLQAEKSISNAPKDSIFKEYYEDGAKKIEAPMTHGKANGKTLLFYQSGKKWKEIDMIDGLKDGKEIAWYENGKLKHVSEFKEDKQNGLTKSYHENGDLESESNFINGNADGETKAYFPGGNLWIDATFDNGKIIRKIIYDKNGNVESNE